MRTDNFSESNELHLKNDYGSEYFEDMAHDMNPVYGF